MDFSAKYVSIAKKSSAFGVIGTAFRNGRGNHAYLLDSPDTLLSQCTAVAVACLDGCETACLTCARCKRIMSGRCADVIALGDGGFMTESADAVVGGCQTTPSELSRKYYILDLSKTNEAAQNKLLKTLEESPECSVFFIIAPSRAALLPTVVSRCETLTPGIAETHLQSIGGEFSPYYDLAMYGARGSLTVFDGLLSGEKASELTTAINFLRNVGNDRLLSGAALLPSKRDTLTSALGFIELVLGDIMKSESGLSVDTRGLYDINELADKYPLSGLPSVLGAVRRAVRRAASGNTASIADTLAITISEVNKVCRK